MQRGCLQRATSQARFFILFHSEKYTYFLMLFVFLMFFDEFLMFCDVLLMFVLCFDYVRSLSIFLFDLFLPLLKEMSETE